jgi:hypothetical protein
MDPIISDPLTLDSLLLRDKASHKNTMILLLSILLVYLGIAMGSNLSFLPNDLAGPPTDIASYVAFAPFFAISSIFYVIGYIIRNIGLMFAWLDWIGACVVIILALWLFWATQWYVPVEDFLMQYHLSTFHSSDAPGVNYFQPHATNIAAAPQWGPKAMPPPMIGAPMHPLEYYI